MERKLAAILAVDIVGYSALMEADEAGTFQRLRAGRAELFEPEIRKHHGRIFKIMGDGLLAEFGSVVDAVECAVTLQRGMHERNSSLAHDQRIETRIGINLGEVIVEGDDRYGEGVNIAVRLEQLASPGGICVSAKVAKEVEKKLAFGFEPMGEHRVKNISEPIACFRVNVESASRHGTVKSSPATQKATIAVLPFTNMSSDPEQEFFADGLAEDLITDLSKMPGLFVISRHSSFAYKGRAMDIRSLSKDLGVRYVIEGSVRRAATRIRINVQLINGQDGEHLWAERFDRELSDVFLLQDEIVRRIAEALPDVIPLSRQISARASNLEAYDLLSRARVMVAHSIQNNRAARPLIRKAIELDPGYSDAHAWLGMSHLYGWVYEGEPEEPASSIAFESASKAVALDPQNAGAHAVLGDVHIFKGNLEEGAAELSLALKINPNHADALVFMGELKFYLGDPGAAVEITRKAFQLNPHPPSWYYWYLGFAEYGAGLYEIAVATLMNRSTYGTGSNRLLAASLAQLGRIDEAKREAQVFLALYPHFSSLEWAKKQPFKRDSDRQHFLDGYRMAGLAD